MNTIYIRTLKRAEHTVFCVSDRQKTYRDPQFGKLVPYSSGQQVKRSLLEMLSENLNEKPSPITFISNVSTNNNISEGEAFATCNPTYADQLLGGWMKAAKGGENRTLKRRSPLSISAMRGLHPLLARVSEENITFDRSERSNTKIIVRDKNKNELSEEQIAALLEGKDRSLSRKFIQDKTRATGLFIQDIAIDLRRLFCVSVNKLEPEITDETKQELIDEGWIAVDTAFGACLLAPKELRDKLIPALAHAIINWKITSNQARTFSLMETLSVAISDNANKIAASIRAKLKEDEEDKAEPIIEENMEGVDTYVSLSAGAYVRTKSEAFDALEKAEKQLIDLMSQFDYEHQL